MFGAMVEGREDESRYGGTCKRIDRGKRVLANLNEASDPDSEELLNG